MMIPDDGTMPAAARLVRDFVNTVEWQVDADEWATPSDLAAWLSRRAAPAPLEVTDGDLERARRIREGLREVFLTHAGHEALPGPLADLNEALSGVPLQMRFDAEGNADVSAADPATPLTPIVLAIAAARADGSWRRVKACSRDSCRWAYWDDSRNRSGRWCSMAGCGNYIKMRRRNALAASAGDAIPLADVAPRVPRMVDVAARAGVSIKTVSNVVTGAAHVSTQTRMRVEAVIDEVGYRPNLAARALRTGRSDLS